MIKVVYIPSILDLDGRTHTIFEYHRDLTVGDYIKKTSIDIKNQKIILSGKKITDFNVKPKNNEDIIITPDIKVEAIIGAILFIGGGSLLWGAIQVIGFVGFLAYGIYAMVSQPRRPAMDLASYTPAGIDQNSPTYGWDGIQTIQEVGVPVAIIYGEHKVGGNIINSYIRYNGDDSYLHVLLALAEGEVESISEIKINDNPIANYEGVSSETRAGENIQTVIEGFEDSHNLASVNVDLPKDSPYVYTTSDNDVEAIEIHLSCTGGLFEATNVGGMVAADITYKVEYKLHTDPDYTDLGTETFSGATRSAVRKVYRIDGLDPGQYDVKVTKTSEDSTTLIQRDLRWTQADEIKTDNLSYPNTALLGIDAMATNQLSGSMPNFTCVVKGRKVSAPTVMNEDEQVDWEDYYWDPEEEEYRLIEDDTILTWDGESYSEQYCANPIWCIKDLLTNDRYGLGEFILTAYMSDSQLLSMSRYCEELLDDGEDGYEKRFRLDVVIDGGGKALDVIAQIATVFRGLPFYSAGGINIKIDKPETAVQVFNMGNIVKESFSETWKSVKEKPNVIEVQYLNASNDYKQEIVAYIDEAAVEAGDPIRKKTVKLFTTKTSQAIREARYALKVAKYIDRTVSFKATIDAIACQAGDVISLSHDIISTGPSGNVVGDTNTTTEIQLDQEVTLAEGSTYKIRIRFADDTIEEKTVSTSAGTTDVIEVIGDPFTSAPAAFDKYMIGTSETVKKDYRIISMSKNNNFEVDITAIVIDSDVYDDTEITLPEDNTQTPTYTTPVVSDLQLFERVYTQLDGTVESAIEVYFVKPSLESYSEVNRYKGANIWIRETEYQPWRLAGYTESDYFQIIGNLVVGTTYYICVTSVPFYGNETSKTTAPNDDITLAGKTTLPSDVSNFAYDFTDQLTLTWDKITDADVGGYEIRVADSNWGVDNADRLYRGLVNKFIYTPESRAPGALYIKAYNTSGSYSENAVSVTPTNAVPNAPTGADAIVFFNFAKLGWTNVADADLKYYEIYRSETDAWAGEETLVAQITGKSTIVQAAKPVGGKTTSSGNSTVVDESLIGEEDDFCIGDIIEITTGDNAGEQKTITDFDGDTGTITISGTWTINPSENDKFIIYDKSYFKVRAVDSYGAGAFSSSVAVTFETITEDALGDEIVTARKVTTGELITLTAQIADAIITNAKISDLAVDKLTAGTLAAIEIIIGAGGLIRSSDYESEVSGFKLDATGGLEVWSGEIKGNTLVLGTVNESRFDETTQSKLGARHAITAGFNLSQIADDNLTPDNPINFYGTSEYKEAEYRFGDGNGNHSSAYFPGTSDISVPDHADWDFTTGDFTIECWIRFNAVDATYSRLWSFGDYTTANGFAAYWCTDNKIYIFNNNASPANFAFTPVANRWYHMAFSRASGNLKVFIDGTQAGSTFDASGIDIQSAEAICFGNWTGVNSDYFVGWMDEIRVSNSARYTSNFTPSTNPFTSDSNTKLLMHFQPPNDFVDSGNTGHTPSVTGKTHCSGHWGNRVLWFDGDSDYALIPDSSDWDIAGSTSQDFTIDFWVRHSDHVGDECYMSQYEDAWNVWYFNHEHGVGLKFVVANGTGNIVSLIGGEISDTKWHHVALCKVTSAGPTVEWGIYLDGTQTAYVSDTSTDTFSGPLFIGAYSSSLYFDGSMDDIRIVHGNPFEAAPNNTPDDTITVPTSKHVLDDDTVLLLPCNMPTQVQVEAGTLYHESTRVNKTDNTILDLPTDSDWFDETIINYWDELSTTEALGYIGVDVSGNVKFLGANAANYTDTSDDFNTDGTHLYYYDTVEETFWRVIGSVRMTAYNSLQQPVTTPTKVIQTSHFQTSDFLTGVSVMPIDDTIPQITEGYEFLAINFKPKNANNTLKIDVFFSYTSDTSNYQAFALFKDSETNAVAATMDYGFNNQNQITLTHYRTAGTTNDTRFSFRAGSSAGAYIRMNGSLAGARYFGGVSMSSITVTELEA